MNKKETPKPKTVAKTTVKPAKFAGKGTRARLNTAAEKMMFNTKASK